MTRVIHTGDTHLGYRQYHRPERREDFLDAFEQVAVDAVAGDVDAVVHAGDLFHDRRPDLPDILGALSVLRDLDDAGVPFLAIVGNHETKRDAQWLDLFESLGLATRLGAAPEYVGDTAFYGLDFVPRSQRADLDYEFEPHDAEHAALVAHGLFEPFEYADWDTETVLSESTVDFDTVLLGDNHSPGKAEVMDTWVTYCGSTERASAEERDDRGYNIVEFDGSVSIRRRGLETREFVFVDVELGEGEGVERVRERVGQYDLADAVVAVTIDGEGDPVTPAAIEEYADEEGALVARVTDHREVTDDADIEVSFADPDDAVRDRIRELGLSEAARDIDETVRASKVADTKVTDEVERRVRDLLEGGDPSAFEPADEGAGADTEGDPVGADDEPEPADSQGDSETAVEADGSDAEGLEPADGTDTPDSDGSGGTDPDAEQGTVGETEPAPEAAAAADDADGSSAGEPEQPSLGDFE